MNKTIMTLFVGALAVAAMSATAQTRDVSERRAAPADGVIEVSNVIGSVQLVGWRRNEVEVTGTLGPGVDRLEFDTHDGRTVIRVHVVREGRNGRVHERDIAANLVIRVPQRSRVVASTVSAPIKAEGIDGDLDLRSVNGDVDAAGGFTRADLQSVAGAVRLRSSGRDARLTVGSISGIVQVEGAHGELHANTVSGTVRVASPGLRRATLKAVSGEAVYEGPLAAGGIYDLETVSGNARLLVEGRADARYDVSVFSGGIRNGFGPRPERTSQHAPGHSLRFTEGQGSAEVRMRSLSGTVHLGRSN